QARMATVSDTQLGKPSAPVDNGRVRALEPSGAVALGAVQDAVELPIRREIENEALPIAVGDKDVPAPTAARLVNGNARRRVAAAGAVRGDMGRRQREAPRAVVDPELRHFTAVG